MYKISKKELNNIKRKIKKVTNIKDIKEIYMIGNTIQYGYYKNNYDKTVNNITIDEINNY